VFIDHLRSGCHQQRIESVSGLVRTSAVVLAELWCAATKRVEREFLRMLEKNHPILTPTEKIGLESGLVLGRVQADKGFSPIPRAIYGVLTRAVMWAPRRVKCLTFHV
jgi:hypothetical protein